MTSCFNNSFSGGTLMTDWITVQEAAKLLNYHEVTITYRIKNNIYRSQKINGRIYVKKDDVFHKEVRANPKKTKINLDGWISQLEAAKLMGYPSNSVIGLWCKSGKLRTKEIVLITNAKYTLVCKEDVLNLMNEIDEVRNSGEWITIDEAAKLLNLCYQTISRRISSGFYTKRKVKGKYYLNKNEVLTKNVKTNREIPEGFISRTEAAKLLGVSQEMIRINIKKGKYITKEIDGKIFLNKESVMNSKKKN